MSSNQAAVLIVDDERSITDLLFEDLANEGYNCVTALSGEDALEKLSRNNFNVALIDLKLPGISGMDVLREAALTHPEMKVIVVTASGDVQTAVEAMKNGATDYITKPFELERVNKSVETVLKTSAIKKTAATTGWMECLDDIARGVETRLDSLTGHMMSKAVIEQTIETARKMEIPRRHIGQWAEARRKSFERVRVLDTLPAMEPMPNS